MKIDTDIGGEIASIFLDGKIARSALQIIDASRDILLSSDEWQLVFNWGYAIDSAYLTPPRPIDHRIDFLDLILQHPNHLL